MLGQALLALLDLLLGGPGLVARRIGRGDLLELGQGLDRLRLIAARLDTTGRILAIDRDDEAIAATREKLQGVKPQVDIARGEFSRISELAAGVGITAASGVIFDLGVSSHQLDSGERGFSYQADAPLDLRMNRDTGMTAADIVNTYSAFELARLLFEKII